MYTSSEWLNLPSKEEFEKSFVFHCLIEENYVDIGNKKVLFAQVRILSILITIQTLYVSNVMVIIAALDQLCPV